MALLVSSESLVLVSTYNSVFQQKQDVSEINPCNAIIPLKKTSSSPTLKYKNKPFPSLLLISYCYSTQFCLLMEMCFHMPNTSNVSAVRINQHQSGLSSFIRSTGSHSSAKAKISRVAVVIHLKTQVHAKLNVVDGKIDKCKWKKLASEFKKKNRVTVCRRANQMFFFKNCYS